MDPQLKPKDPMEFSSASLNTLLQGVVLLMLFAIHWGLAYSGILSFRNLSMLYAWGAFTFFYFKIRGRRTKRSWNEMGQALGLTVERGWSFRGGVASFFRLKGSENGSPIVITGRRMKSLEKWYLHIKKTTPHPVGVAARRGGPLLTTPIVLTSLPGNPLLLFDGENPNTVRLRALDEYAAIAVLTAPVRKRLRHLIETADTVLRDGAVELIESERRMVKKAEDVIPILREALDVLTDLNLDPAQLKARLSENVRGDPHPNMRLRNLLLLQRRFPNDDEVKMVTQQALTDPDPLVRLRAHLYFGHADIRTEMEDMKSTREEDHAPESFADLADVLSAAVGAAAEGVFIHWLKARSERILVAMAKALAAVGTAAAVPPLYAVADSKSRSPLVRTTARRAIGLIQSRIDPDKLGSFSLSGEGEKEGDLSLDPEHGEVSLDE